MLRPDVTETEKPVSFPEKPRLPEPFLPASLSDKELEPGTLEEDVRNFSGLTVSDLALLCFNFVVSGSYFVDKEPEASLCALIRKEVFCRGGNLAEAEIAKVTVLVTGLTSVGGTAIF